MCLIWLAALWLTSFPPYLHPTLLLLLLLILVSPPPLLSHPGGLRTSQQYPPPSESPHEVGEQRHWVHPSAAMASTWKWQQTTHSSNFKDYAHLFVKCPRKKNLYVMINPLLKGRKLSAKKRVLLDFSASEMWKMKNYASWLSHLWALVLSPLSVIVLNCCFVILPPQMGLGTCKRWLCVWESLFPSGGEVLSLHVRSPYEKTQVLQVL